MTPGAEIIVALIVAFVVTIVAVVITYMFVGGRKP